MNWKNNVTSIEKILSLLSIRDNHGDEIDVDSGFQKWLDYTIKIKNTNGTAYFVGNGASASIASHISADVGKNAKLRTEIFTDLSLITAIANDISYNNVFSEPLSWKMNIGDIIVAISSSGSSPNILEAVKTAALKKAFIVTLSAMNPDNPLRKIGDLNFYVPADTYGYAEVSHTAILHYWVDIILNSNF